VVGTAAAFHEAGAQLLAAATPGDTRTMMAVAEVASLVATAEALALQTPLATELQVSQRVDQVDPHGRWKRPTTTHTTI
jgi:hypothetical protein